MKQGVGICFVWVWLLVPAAATEYFVDFDGGNDGHAGTTPATAWQRAPGDPLALGVAAATPLRPGDTVYFKGGVHYRGRIRIAHSGAANSPICITGDGWPGLEGVKAIIDGTDPYGGSWTRCVSPADCGGNPHWSNIYYSDASTEISPFTQLFENGERVYMAQAPNMSDPFWDDRYGEYFPVAPRNITLTSITDPSVFTQADSRYWDGAYIMIWVNPNIIVIRTITAYHPATATVFFDSLESNALYGDRDQYYSLVNHLHALDRPGEYVINESTRRIYYWPLGPIADMSLAVSTRANGLSTRARSHLVIEGFVFHGFTSDTYARAIMDEYANPRGRDLTIQHNEIRWTRSRDGRRGSVEISYTNGVTLQHNLIHHCQRNSGLLIGTDDLLIQDNEFAKVGYKGLWFMGVQNARVLRNRFVECSGTHGNPASIFTSENVLVAHNQFFGHSEVLTFERDGNLVIHNNVIHSRLESGREVGTYVLRENGDNGYGYHVITNNTILNSRTNFALGISGHAADPRKLIIHNNIADGGGNFLANVVSHNLYTGLSWVQRQSGWHLSEGEILEPDLTAIFVDAARDNLRLTESSVARNAGVDLVSQLPMEVLELFPDFDFAFDIEGTRRGNGGGWDVGAYAFQPETVQNIDLAAGWNWMSFHVRPADRSLNGVFAGVLDRVEQVRGQTRSALRVGSSWVGDLADMDGISHGWMYKVRVSASCRLQIRGLPILANAPIPLAGGWNWVAFYPGDPQPIVTALAAILGQAQQARSQTQSAIPGSGAWLGDLTWLYPGQGYALQVSGPVNLIYPGE